MPEIKAVIWDMDGTLFDTENLVMEICTEIFEEMGYARAREVIHRCIGRNVRDSNAIIKEEYGEDFPIEEFRKRKAERFAAHLKEHGLPPKLGVQESLSWIGERGIPMAVASGSDHAKILHFLELAGLKDRFSVIVGGDEIKKGKPDPELFLKVSELLDVSPENCIVFEDSSYGIIAAHRAGMQVVLIPDLAQIDDASKVHAHFILQSAEEIPALLENLAGKKD